MLKRYKWTCSLGMYSGLCEKYSTETLTVMVLGFRDIIGNLEKDSACLLYIFSLFQGSDDHSLIDDTLEEFIHINIELN